MVALSSHRLRSKLLCMLYTYYRKQIARQLRTQFVEPRGHLRDLEI